MKVREILDHKGGRVITIRPDATLSTAIHRLALERIGALVVSEDGVTIAGILSERDVVRALAEDGAAILAPDRHVRDLMTTGVRTCGPEDTVKAVMAEMTRHRIRHLPVVADRRLVGVVSIGDVVKSRLDEMELETVVLREAYIAGH
jgi:CBS domain-containing protein